MALLLSKSCITSMYDGVHPVADIWFRLIYHLYTYHCDVDTQKQNKCIGFRRGSLFFYAVILCFFLFVLQNGIIYDKIQSKWRGIKIPYGNASRTRFVQSGKIEIGSFERAASKKLKLPFRLHLLRFFPKGFSRNARRCRQGSLELM